MLPPLETTMTLPNPRLAKEGGVPAALPMSNGNSSVAAQRNRPQLSYRDRSSVFARVFAKSAFWKCCTGKNKLYH
jgi:hypothetical protein